MATAFFSKIVSHRSSISIDPSDFSRGGRIPPGSIVLPRVVRARPETDSHAITIPNNQEYVHSIAISVPPSSEGATVQVTSQPASGATGNGTIKVQWFCPPGGEIRYRIRAYATAQQSPASGASSTPTYEEVHVVNNESVERLRSLLNARRHVKVVFSGDDAVKIQGTPIPHMMSGVTGMEIVAIIGAAAVIVGILAAATVSVIAIAAITEIVLKAIEKNYHCDVEFETGGWSTSGTFTLPKMVFTLTPQPS